jgi:hypothetical protein
MNNEQLSNIPPLIVIACVVLAFLGIMAYQYRQQLKFIKGGFTAILIALGLYDDTNNNNGATS